MKHEEPQPGDEALDRALRKSFRELEAARGPCPTAAQLVKYQSAELGAEESAAIRRHVVLCGACELYVERLEEFDGAAVAAEEEAGPLRGELRSALRGRRFGLFGNPAVGYVLALLLCYPAYRGLVPKTAPSEPRGVDRKTPPAVAAIRVFELPETRPASEALTRIELQPGEERFSLSFFVPGRKGGRYAAQIHDSSGQTVGGSPNLVPTSLGACILLCETAVFQTGRYKLTVTENDPAGGAAARRFDYDFEVRLRSRE